MSCLGCYVDAVGLPDDQRIGGGFIAILVVRSPKNRAHMGEQQFISIESPSVVRWLRWWLQVRKPHERVFPGRDIVMGCYKSVLLELGLGHMGFTLASLRTGGATAHFRHYRNIAKLQYAGRWANPSTLAFYLQETMAQAALQS